MDELLPCPFCGGEANMIERATAPDGPGFFCAISCFCGGYSARAHQAATASTIEGARSEAIAAWNKRAGIEALEARCERYREALARIASFIDGQAAYDGESAQIIASAALEEAGNGRG